MLFVRVEVLEGGRAIYAVERLQEGKWCRVREIVVEHTTEGRKLALDENERLVIEPAMSDVLLFDKEQMSVRRERRRASSVERFEQEELEVLDANA